MKYYLNVYRAIFSINLSNLLIHRGNFLNNIISSISWGIFSVASIIVLTSQTPQVFSWSRDEIILLTGGYSILTGIFHTLFSRNFEKMSEIIHRGQLDLLLAKPVDSQFLVSTRFVNYASLFRIIVGLFVIIFMFNKLSININFWQFLCFVALVIIGVLILYNIWFIAITLTIWFTKLYNLPDFMYSFSSIARFPPEMLKAVSFYIFVFLFPLTLIIALPVKIFLNRFILVDIFWALLIVLMLAIIARKFWLFALKSYTSAGG